MRLKFFVFVVGVLMLIVSAIGLMISLGYTPAFISILPQDLRVYFGIDIFLGLVAIGLSFSRTMY